MERVLAEPEWRERQRVHEGRVRTWTDPHQARAQRGEKHPVYDFLFTYYAFRPAWLRRWHPGPGVGLTGESAREFLRWPEYREYVLAGNTGCELQDARCEMQEAGAGGRIAESGIQAATSGIRKAARFHPISGLPVPASRPCGTLIAIDPAALPAHRWEFVRRLRDLLRAMQTRPAFFGCHGLHEWAMVYRQADAVRHGAWPLRFAPAALAKIVEASAICCSHFDAFRFFTGPARPLNRLQPTRTSAPELEQRGCLHANMDLYKWAFKLAPFTPGELMADCFELARDIREVDMRASPYDLRALGFEPIAVETVAGRAEYERFQRGFAERGEPLRARLIALCERLLG